VTYPVGDPIGDDRSGRRMALVLVAVGIVAIAVFGYLVYGWATSGSDDDVAADEVGAAIGAGESTEHVEGQSETPTTGETPTTAPAAPRDLLRTDARKPFEAFAKMYGGQPVKVNEILVYEDWAQIQVQVPGEPTHLDEYAWRGGDGVSGPEPVDLLSMEVDELPQKLFDLSELDASKLPAMTAQGLAQFPEDGMEVTHVIIDRFLPFDTRVLVRVYVSDPERGGGGYVEFTPDGGLVEKVA
jgi:hypothetical protein